MIRAQITKSGDRSSDALLLYPKHIHFLIPQSIDPEEDARTTRPTPPVATLIADPPFNGLITVAEEPSPALPCRRIRIKADKN